MSAGVVLAAIGVVVALLTMTRSSNIASTAGGAAAPRGASSRPSAPGTTSTAASTTVPATTVPGTTVPAATAVPGATASPVPTPQQALNAIVTTLGPTYAVSPIAGQDKSMFVAIDHPAAQAGGGSTIVVDIYQYVGARWLPQASVPLGADGSTGLLLPARQDTTPITVVAVTGSAEPDYAVTTASASSLITTIVSDQTGKWQAVPFDAPTGTVTGVPDATLQQSTITATFNSCTPTCATGASRRVTFTYQGGVFVPLAG